MKKIVIAIDGHSSSGKSTMAKDLAKEIGYTYIDTGAMYRAVTLYCIQHGFFEGEKIKEEELKASIHDIDISFRLNAETGRPDTYLNGVNVEKEIRGMEVADKVSPVATLGFVRRALVAKQQEMGKAKGIVMDGRDIGTVVFPDAELKLFVTASPEVRADHRPGPDRPHEADRRQRRHRRLRGAGECEEAGLYRFNPGGKSFETS